MTGSTSMMRRKSLSLEKAPAERLNRRDRRSSVAAGPLPSSLPSEDVKERRGSLVHRWFRHLSDAADAYKNRNGRTGRPETGPASHTPAPDAETSEDHPDKARDPEDGAGGDRKSYLPSMRLDPDTSGTSADSSDSNLSQEASPAPKTSTPTHDAEPHIRKPLESSPSLRQPVDALRLCTVENQLIEPSEIVVSQKSVLTAEPVLTPLEQLRLQDMEIRRALKTKQELVADILHVPQEEFRNIADMAGEPGVDKEASELVLAAISQANQLTEALNESLRVSEEDAVSFVSGVEPGCSPRNRRRARLPGLPIPRVQNISTALNTHLTQLLEMVKERDDERDKLRRELQKYREQIHSLHEAHRKDGHLCSTCSQRTAPDKDTGTASCVSPDLLSPPPIAEAGPDRPDNDNHDRVQDAADDQTKIDSCLTPDNPLTDTSTEVSVDTPSDDQTRIEFSQEVTKGEEERSEATDPSSAESSAALESSTSHPADPPHEE